MTDLTDRVRPRVCVCVRACACACACVQERAGSARRPADLPRAAGSGGSVRVQSSLRVSRANMVRRSWLIPAVGTLSAVLLVVGISLFVSPIFRDMMEKRLKKVKEHNDSNCNNDNRIFPVEFEDLISCQALKL